MDTTRPHIVTYAFWKPLNFTAKRIEPTNKACLSDYGYICNVNQ